MFFEKNERTYGLASVGEKKKQEREIKLYLALHRRKRNEKK